MKHTAITLAIALIATFAAKAQAPKAKAGQEPKTLKEVMKLHIDRSGGANAASVVWHPVQKKYYAAQAGNESFPMLVFDAKGKKLSDENQETLFDVRGFWYNPNTKALQANGYGDLGWAEYKLNGKGMPVSVKKLEVETGKPDAQSVGAYDAKKNVLYYFDYTAVGLERHKIKDGVSDTTIVLHLGARTKNDIVENQDDAKLNYNENTIIYTGMPGAEIGLLNYNEKQIELYSLASGLMTKVYKLPEDAPASQSLNFSYANGIFWLNDKTERTWHGYKG